jgi:predicted hotdog family 3-hydroxylacyl-ACP dehydratase
VTEVIELSALIPHQGTMCLLERIIEWNDASITIESDSHRSVSHPLRSANGLRAIHLCEYGAQAMAVHGALRSRGAQERPKPGMLVSLRNVQLRRDYIDDLEGTLVVQADCLQATADSLQYTFRVTHHEDLLAEGRAMVVLGK